MNDKKQSSADGSVAPASRRLRPSGGYRVLRSFRATTVIYDGTVRFCDRFLDSRSRTVDQMVQAARSGRQNIAEGSRAAATSSQTELRLVNVARASLDELLLDYEDYLRQHRLRQWGKDDPEALAVRAVGRGAVQRDHSDPADDYAGYVRWLDHESPEVVANALICLIHQANYLLDRQISAIERAFVEGGGYSERLAVERIAWRRKQSGQQADQTNRGNAPPAAPVCPRCGQPMSLRTARKGPKAGSQFWGCSAYPNCRATLALDDLTDPTDRPDQSPSVSKGKAKP